MFEVIFIIILLVLLKKIYSDISQQILVDVTDFLTLNRKVVQVCWELFRYTLALHSKVSSYLSQVCFLALCNNLLLFFLDLFLLLLDPFIDSRCCKNGVNLIVLKSICSISILALLKYLENVIRLLSKRLIIFHIFFYIHDILSSFLD